MLISNFLLDIMTPFFVILQKRISKRKNLQQNLMQFDSNETIFNTIIIFFQLCILIPISPFIILLMPIVFFIIF